MSESTYDRIRKERCEWCRRGMPFISSIRRMGAPPVHEVSSPGSNSDDYEPCTAPSPEAVIEEQAVELSAEKAARESAERERDDWKRLHALGEQSERRAISYYETCISELTAQLAAMSAEKEKV